MYYSTHRKTKGSQVGKAQAMEGETSWHIDLMGSYSHKVDAKGRLALPAQFRKVLPTDLVVTVDMKDQALRVYDQDDFNRWVDQFFVDRFGKYDSSSVQHEAIKRKLKSRSMPVTIDSAGRIGLSKAQREKVGIDTDVVIVGNTGYFEVWDAASFEQADDEIDLASFMQ